MSEQNESTGATAVPEIEFAALVGIDWGDQQHAWLERQWNSLGRSCGQPEQAGQHNQPLAHGSDSSTGSSTHIRSGCFICPAWMPAASPSPQKKSARTGPLMAPPVSWAIISR